MKKDFKSQKEWVEKRSKLEAQLQMLTPEVHKLSEKAERASYAAIGAERRLKECGPVNDFSKNKKRDDGYPGKWVLYTHDSGPGYGTPVYNKREFEIAKKEAEQKRKIATQAKKEYEEEKLRLDKVKHEFEELEFPSASVKFQSSGVEMLLNNSVAPWVSLIKETCKLINKLKEKRDDLYAEKQQNDTAIPVLDENSLLNADVEEHHTDLRAVKDSSDKTQTIENLIEQLDQKIAERETELEKQREDFSSALREVVKQYNRLVSREISDQLNQAVKTDSFYSEAVDKACNELLKEVGVSQSYVFPIPLFGSHHLLNSPLQANEALKSEIDNFMKNSA